VAAQGASLMQVWQDIAFFDDRLPDNSINNIKSAPNNSFDIFIAIGKNVVRQKLQDEFSLLGFNIVNIVHPSAIIANSAIIGEGSLLAAGAIINPDTKVGRGCIINTGATVDHDCELKDFVHISPGVNLAGSVCVGNRSWAGIGSCVIENIIIGDDVIIGAGAVVISHVDNNKKVFGVPAIDGATK